MNCPKCGEEAIKVTQPWGSKWYLCRKCKSYLGKVERRRK